MHSVVLACVILACCTFAFCATAPVSDEELAKMREQMVSRQIAGRGVRDEQVLNAMRKVKRHEFVLPGQERLAYDDSPLPIGEGQTISQPYIVALMTELARIDSSSKVLEIGTGSGYQAAVLGEIAKQVYSIEIIDVLGTRADALLKSLGYTNIHVRIGDGYKGWPEEAPFDAILVTAAPEHIPDPLIQQLRVGGRMVIPVGHFYQELEVVTRTPDGLKQEKTIPVRFVPMTGEAEKH